MKKYVLCLVPNLLSRTDFYCEVSDSLANRTNYRLNNVSSLPHISIVQFECDRVETLNGIWKFATLEENDGLTEEVWGVVFTAVSVKNRSYEDFYVEAAVSCQGLDRLHEAFCDIVETTYDLRIFNAKRGNFKPHLTLGSVKRGPSMALPTHLINTTDKFDLALGELNENFELISIIKI
jgi:hypothetical protein